MADPTLDDRIREIVRSEIESAMQDLSLDVQRSDTHRGARLQVIINYRGRPVTSDWLDLSSLKE